MQGFKLYQRFPFYTDKEAIQITRRALFDWFIFSYFVVWALVYGSSMVIVYVVIVKYIQEASKHHFSFKFFSCIVLSE